ncbi:hypothetical protein SPRG_02518 [Saprolegnia parasitica CBS 223.65]|uniref:Uncharacterized protein n=1 Tax=Saprolegnia parasitica (strain CBS 223.65) TaxID=695850 RepID=A0A067CU97_SAPPC|nr:hypothetical protein SPRG_02518 [Saprolegnia parasitica CBS 223.65]KDO32825.1 hypothetical protein SPRG_02518 [Saprolegnia parasitica CBS 223.65]|eukprot:XP_012196480.1 hypothetical protein SPRG_02518 [Saprolegnia parasitica CBS 223.65]
MLGKIVGEAKLDITFNEAYLLAVQDATTSSPTTRKASKPSTIMAWLRECLELGGFKQDGRGMRKRDN